MQSNQNWREERTILQLCSTASTPQCSGYEEYNQLRLTDCRDLTYHDPHHGGASMSAKKSYSSLSYQCLTIRARIDLRQGIAVVHPEDEDIDHAGEQEQASAQAPSS